MSFALMARLVHHSSHTAHAPPVERSDMPATATTTAPSVLIRAARGSDGAALERLAAARLRRASPPARCSWPRPTAALVAAIASSTGEAIADPFLPTADVVALLELRAAGASAPARAAASPPRGSGLRPRAARPGPRERRHHRPTHDPAGRRRLPQGAGRRSFRRPAGRSGRRCGSSTSSGARPTWRSGSSSRRCRRCSAPARASGSPAPCWSPCSRCSAASRPCGRPAPSSPARRSSGCCCPAPTRSSPSPSRRCPRASPRC